MLRGDQFELMFRRKDSKGHKTDAAERMFYVTDRDFEMVVMSHAELVEKINALALLAD